MARQMWDHHGAVYRAVCTITPLGDEYEGGAGESFERIMGPFLDKGSAKAAVTRLRRDLAYGHLWRFGPGDWTQAVVTAEIEVSLLDWRAA